MQRRILMIALIGAVGCIGSIAYFVATISARPRAASYREAVMRVLDERRVDYRDVVVVDGCAPSYQFCRSYAGSVQVLAATTITGQIHCRERWTTCTLSIPQVGIDGAPLDDTLDPFWARWEELYGRFIMWAHEVSKL
jgi:hypothetical protein